MKPNLVMMRLADGSISKMHIVQKTTTEVNSTYVEESVKLTIKYDLMGVLSYFKCSLHGNQDLRCQGWYKCIADFSPPRKGVYMENVAIVNLDGIIRKFNDIILSQYVILFYCLIFYRQTLT